MTIYDQDGRPAMPNKPIYRGINQPVKIYEVGGCVRDYLMGYKSKDVDFVVTASSFDAMRDYLVEQGFKIYIEKPEYGTIRACVPEGHDLRTRTKDADFVLARKDGPSSDGRRPDYVEPGSLYDDLARRDFTINAIAKTRFGYFIDPFDGKRDCKNRILRFVGDPATRIEEDGLRILRGFRFIVTKNLIAAPATLGALFNKPHEKLSGVSVERIREEVEKMLKFDTLKTLELFKQFPALFLEGIFKDGLRLSATMRD